MPAETETCGQEERYSFSLQLPAPPLWHNYPKLYLSSLASGGAGRESLDPCGGPRLTGPLGDGGGGSGAVTPLAAGEPRRRHSFTQHGRAASAVPAQLRKAPLAPGGGGGSAMTLGEHQRSGSGEPAQLLSPPPAPYAGGGGAGALSPVAEDDFNTVRRAPNGSGGGGGGGGGGDGDVPPPYPPPLLSPTGAASAVGPEPWDVDNLRFQRGDLLGKGGFGRVYRALNLNNATVCVVCL